ncbi:MAG TPA: branched-chain amino acid transaminase [Longimicrobiales bacterium]|nr:branched-chain amino acid transaminase [Longimicrobiales bacterium]
MAAAGLQAVDWIWRDGEFVPWEDAKLHLLATAVQFGTSVFEGIRAYGTARGPAVFRLEEHVRRLLDSARIYRMLPEYSHQALCDACRATVSKNGLEDCYIRPMILRGYGAAGLNPLNSPIETYVAAWPGGAYLGEGALSGGVDVCVTSWQRAMPNTFPARAKAGGQYVNAQLMKMEAITNGYADAIALGPGGLVSEGTGMNLFLVREGVIVTPVLDGTSLVGITRGAVIQMAKDLGYEVREEPVPRESLYAADEMFFTGTAAEVTPIRSVDRIPVGTGTAGPITLALQKRFMQTVRGEIEDTHGWLTYVGD